MSDAGGQLKVDAGSEVAVDAGVDAGWDAGVIPPDFWFETSARVQLATTWTGQIIGAPDAATRGYICRTAARDELTAEQLATFSNLRLVPYVSECMVDGRSFDTLTVFDSDGGVFSINSATCDEPTREWMLPWYAKSQLGALGAPCVDPISFQDGGGPGPGANVWFDTSASLKLMLTIYSLPSIVHSKTCREVTRAQLSPEQKTQLSALTLGPMTFASDPWAVEELVVLDADGGEMTYRSVEGTSYRLPDQRGRFEPGLYATFADAGTSIDCW